VPIDSGRSVHDFAVAKSLTQSLSWAVWHSKRRCTPHHTPRGPYPSARPASARAANDREPGSPLRTYWSDYELTHRTQGSRQAAGSRSIRTECPNLLAHYFYLWGTTVVWQAIEIAWICASLGGHSQFYCVARDLVFLKYLFVSLETKAAKPTPNVHSLLLRGSPLAAAKSLLLAGLKVQQS